MNLLINSVLRRYLIYSTPYNLIITCYNHVGLEHPRLPTRSVHIRVDLHFGEREREKKNHFA